MAYLVPRRVRPKRVFGCQHAAAYYDAHEDEIAPIRMCTYIVEQQPETAIIVTADISMQIHSNFCNLITELIQYD